MVRRRPDWQRGSVVALRYVGLGVAAAALLGVVVGETAPTTLTSGVAAAETNVQTTSPPATRPPGTTSPSRITTPPATIPPNTVAPTTIVATPPSPARTPVPTPPPATYYYRTAPTYSYSTVPLTAAPTSTTPPTPTTIAPIGGHIPVPPSTLPLRTKTQSAHVSPVFPALSGVGFFVAFLIVAGRFVMTRPGRKR